MPRRQSTPAAILITGLALFAMYFGAGNLIFPAMIGMTAGENVNPVIIGFLLTGVALPALGMVASSTQRRGEHDGIASRIGRYPSLVFTVAIFLSTGMLYAIPRVATVSFEMAAVPILTGSAGGETSQLDLLIYTVIFFTAVGVVALNPGRLVDRLGAYLTPALLIVLAILIVTALVTMESVSVQPSPDYANDPLPAGLLQGYYTMDAIASLVFSGVILSALARSGFTTRRKLIWGSTLAAGVAGIGLTIVYLGLAAVGTRVAGQGLDDGAAGLAYAASEALGPVGQAVFSAVAILACLTTAIGLIGASSQYFRKLFPKLTHPMLVLIQSLVALSLANLGLETILEIVTPVNQLLYPIAICIIAIALIDVVTPGMLHWTYRLSAWTAAVVAIPEALWATKISAFDGLRDWLDVLPAGSVNMGWVVPALVAALIGALLDLSQGRLRPVTGGNELPILIYE